MKFQRFTFLFLSLGVILSCFSCKEGTVSEDLLIDFGYDYYPLKTGNYWEYQTDSIVFDFDGNIAFIDTSTTFVREEITGIQIDSEGDTIFVLERLEKENLADSWLVRDVWSVKKTAATLERVEENIRLVKMVFPLQEGVDFDATIFIEDNFTVVVAGEFLEKFKGWASQVDAVGEQETIGGIDYPEVTTITYADEENLIERRWAYSKFAKNVGMVYTEEWILDTQILTEDIPWEEKAEVGYILRQTLIDHN